MSLSLPALPPNIASSQPADGRQSGQPHQDWSPRLFVALIRHGAISFRRRETYDGLGPGGLCILRAPGRSAKHKMSQLPTAYGLMGLGKSKKWKSRTPHRYGRLRVEAGEKNFSFVNESPRCLLSRRAGIEGRGALRSFALTT